MEDKFQTLIHSNDPENRNKWALEWKEQGHKVIGLLDIYVPEEIISAAGLLPWRITGTWDAAVPRAAVHRPSMTCRYCTHVLESFMNGDLDFVDGLVTNQIDDDFKRLYDVLNYIDKPGFLHIMYLPHTTSKTTLDMWKKSVNSFKEAIETYSGNKIDPDELQRQVLIYNKMRALLREVYELRKREVPALTGAEALGLTSAARIMPRELFNEQLEQLIPYLNERKIEKSDGKPRIFMGGEWLDHPGYVRLVENAGATVVMDEFDTGSQYFWDIVYDTSDDLLGALAKRYMMRPGLSRMAQWEMQANRNLAWINEFNADGVVELRSLYSLPLDYRYLFMRKIYDSNNIFYLSLNREYHLSGQGMLQTRIEAFLEMVERKSRATSV
ncbi:MAG: 2-hydroxyacyl-CoA dehydratase family protein [Desulfobacteraceae bacterium]|jgi:benzoyl-CoA reductase/2-hydroxyglutaryl-CoA dehydratase subunit BcrC/BadD/HgdB|nr:2-hydroxyacyl-CoA dehydratase family protein [Desulfobacteraceae bacterium]